MKNFTSINTNVIYSSNFYLAIDTMTHERIAYTIWVLLSDFGGILGILIPFVLAINSPISYVFIMAQLIAKVYFYRPKNR